MVSIIVSERRLAGHIADRIFESLNGPAVEAFVTTENKHVKRLNAFADGGIDVEISCVKEDRNCVIKETRDEPDDV
jgi:hypothetical protein